MQFHYVAINQDNQKLSGSIHADNQESARKELNKLGFSVLSVEEVSQTANQAIQSSELNKYKFEAIDTNGKKIIGTISSKDSQNAYQRLINEYHFKVEVLADIKNPEDPEDLMALAQYLESLSKSNNSLKLTALIEEKETKQQNTFSSEIESIIVNIKKILEDFTNNFTPETKKTINDYLDKLIRLKSSFNQSYVKQTTEELLDLFSKEESFEISTSTDIKNKILLESQKMLIKLNTGNSTLLQKKQEQPLKKEEESNLSSPTNQTKNENECPNNIDFLEHKILSNKQEIKNDILLFFKSTKDNREILKTEISKLWTENKELKRKLNKNNNLQKEKKNIWNEIYYFSGWLLIFYLIYYFISYYLWSKSILPQRELFELQRTIANPYKTSIIRNIMILLFFTHCLMSIQKNLSQEQKKQKLWISAFAGFIISILIISNF